MKHGPLQPAQIEWADDGTPLAPAFGDIYHGPVGAAAQARHVFLAGNGLPARWAGRDDFCIAETGFGLGNNFLATWAAWRADPQRPRRLHYVSIEAHPPQRHDLQRAHALHKGVATAASVADEPVGATAADLAAPHDTVQAAADRATLAHALHAAWPPLVPGLHRIDFDNGAVQLLLAFGDVSALLPQLVFAADAFYLDGFAPALNPAMWDRRVLRALGRRARLGATAATWSVARELRDGLTAAGFVWQRVPGIGGKFHVLHAQHQPRAAVKAASASAWGSVSPTTAAVASIASARPQPAPQRRAVVVGAGLAGACTAAALARQGFVVTVLDRVAQPAAGSSGNVGGLFHATMHGDDGPHARLLRAGALHTARWLAGADSARLPHAAQGLLRLENTRTLAAMQALIDAQGLPADMVQAMSAAQASARAGVPLTAPAWFYPGAGWLSPRALVQQALAQPGVEFQGQADVAAVRREGDEWLCLDAQGHCLARASHLVLAAAEQVNPLLQSLGHAPLPLQRNRGQVSGFDMAPPVALRLPVAGDGYALPLPGAVLCGATSTDGDDDPHLRASDHRHNFERLQRLTGLQAPADPVRWWGRVGWRVQTADRLPIAGPLPSLPQAGDPVCDQARRLPREPGLHLLCALGGRGLTLAPLLADVVAARVAGAPLPLEQPLLDAVDPGRWIVRAVRRAAGGGGSA